MFFSAAVDAHSLDTQILFIYVFFISLTVFRHFAYTDNEARSKNACEKRFRNGILQVLKLKLQEMREKTFLNAKILREG